MSNYCKFIGTSDLEKELVMIVVSKGDTGYISDYTVGLFVIP